jgi:hypothetical protein
VVNLTDGDDGTLHNGSGSEEGLSPGQAALHTSFTSAGPGPGT